MRPFPLYYLTTRRFAKRLTEGLTGAQGAGAPTKSKGEFVTRLVADDLRASTGRLDITELNGETTLAFHVGEWLLDGRKTFILPRELTEAFSASDISAISLSDILPSELGCWYIAFEGSTITLPGLPGVVEGAFWRMQSPAEASVIFASRAPTPGDTRTRTTEGYRVPFLFTTFKLPANQAIEQALRDDIADLESVTAKADGSGLSEARQAAIDRHHLAKDALRQAMALTLNAMAFLKAYPEDQVDSWPAGTPAALAEKATQVSSPTTRARALSKLWALGWAPVRRLGAQVARRIQAAAMRPSGRQAHWRTHHWRNQAYGSAFSLRKLIFIEGQWIGLDLDKDE